ncbi:MAG: helix-turn-helix domain-containing protein [Paracoccaceae bacterium]|nr:helix-turn-helix domain-containing protein [Paracoccaceae bacterium]
MSANSDFAQEIAEAVLSHISTMIRTGELPVVTEFVGIEEAAKICDVTPAGLKAMRDTARGPTYSKPTPRIVRYRVSDLEAWLASNRVEPGAEN